jgi:hypothetical protein
MKRQGALLALALLEGSPGLQVANRLLFNMDFRMLQEAVAELYSDFAPTSAETQTWGCSGLCNCQDCKREVGHLVRRTLLCI